MIDVRELRIGNHVLWNGERVEIDEISIGDVVGCIVKDGSDWFGYDAYRLEPIPITEELLKELGFVEEKPPTEGWTYGIEKVFSKMYDAPIESEDPYISLAQYEEGLYQLQVEGTIAYVRYLHEMENFVYMTTKKDLI